jgi:hypothetical protein
MRKLTQIQFGKAREFLKTQARPLERSLFNHYFEDAPADLVIAELKKFQNSDGGFGNALEPDMQSPSSSALATEMGLRTLVEIGVSADHPVVTAAVAYGLNSLDPQTLTWRVVPLDVNDHPHAPWWHDEEGSLERTFDNCIIIPRAGIIGVLYHYAELLPAGWLANLTKATLRAVKDMDAEKFNGGGDSLVYARKLAEAPGLAAKEKTWLSEQVRQLANQIVTRNPEDWSQYCAPPLKLAPTPESITADVLSDCLPTHLDYTIEGQYPEGFWDVTWAWNDYPDTWKIAKREWRGCLTLGTLLSLKAYSRIELNR